MKNLTTKWLSIAVWALSWLLLFWINFAAELSLMMHFFAIPVLLLITTFSVGRYLEPDDNDKAGD